MSGETPPPPEDPQQSVLLQFCVGGCWKRGEQTVDQLAKTAGLEQTPGRNSVTEILINGRRVTLDLLSYCLNRCATNPAARVKPHARTHVAVYFTADSPEAVTDAIARLDKGDSDV